MRTYDASELSIKQRQLALQLHFSSVPAQLALSLLCLGYNRGWENICQISFEDWQEASKLVLESFGEDQDKLPQINWTSWQHSRGKAQELVQNYSLETGSAAEMETLLLYGSPLYPKPLYQLYRPPFALFARGNRHLFATETASGFAVCGSRKVTLQGRSDAYILAYGVCRSSDFHLISGLSEGIELAACEGALAAQAARLLQTAPEQKGVESQGQDRAKPPSQAPIAPIAGILCCGLDAIAPAESRQMASRILAAGGLLLSEYWVSQPRQSYTFLQRNRILAALAASLIMVELGPRTKALNLVNYALELNHDVALLGESLGVGRLREQGCAHWPDAPALLKALGLWGKDWDLSMEEYRCKSYPQTQIGQLVSEGVYNELINQQSSYLGRRFVEIKPDE